MPTYAVQLTAPGTAAIAVIALTGDRAADILAQLVPQAHEFPLNTPRRAALADLDDSIILRTHATRFELHIHGGGAVTRSLLEKLQQLGAALASEEPIHSLLDEITAVLPRAHTTTAVQLLAAQATAGLTAFVTHWLAHLTDANLWQLQSAAQWVLTRARSLQFLLTPARIAIIGPPNAGKSTLANALLGRPVAITSNIPGTTRDWVDAQAILAHHNIHVPIALIDTAGVRPTDDPIEREAILRSHAQAAAADLILLLFDASQLFSEESRVLLAKYSDRPHILVANKSDLVSSPPVGFLPISAKTHANLDALAEKILTRLDLLRIAPTEPFPFTPRQLNTLVQLTAAPTATDARAFLRQIMAPHPPEYQG